MQTSPLHGLSFLLLEDEVLLRKQITALLERLGVDVTAAATVQAARQLAQELSFDFALLDVNLPDGLGTDLLREKALGPHTGVIIMTANSAIEGAVEAMRLGALDYLAKPFDPAELPLVIARARRARQGVRADEHRRQDTGQDGFFFGSALAAMHAQLEKILAADRRIQGCPPPVLIQGETGTGKTTIARWIHHHGPRAAAPLIEVNCSALPESLAESELFGHEKGAFTDARTARMGLFEAAHGGTLFLDELPSLSPALQAKVLTAVEDLKIRRVGGNKPVAVDVRLVAATNRDLKAAVAAGEFREDLYHRLDLFRIAIPPLRERGEDIVRLAGEIIHRLAARHRLPVRPVTPLGRQRLLAHRWPGNVRELAHELERAIVFEDSEELNFEHLFPGGSALLAEEKAAPSSGTGAPSGDWFREEFVFPESGFVMEEAITRLLQHALRQSGGNVSAAARKLGVTRDYLRYRIEPPKPPTH